MSQLDAGIRQQASGRRAVTVGLFVTLLELFDLTVIAGTGVFSSWVRFGSVDLSGSRGLVIVLSVAIALIVFRWTALHEEATLNDPFRQAKRAAWSAVLILVAVIAVGYATKTAEAHSRLWAIMWLAGSFCFLVLSRPGVAQLFRQLEAAGGLTTRYAVFGYADEMDRLNAFLERWNGAAGKSDSLVGVFLDAPGNLRGCALKGGHQVTGSFEDFFAWRKATPVDRVIVSARPENEARVEAILEKLRALSLDVDLVVGYVDKCWSQRPLGRLADLPVVRVMTEPLSTPQYLIKRSEDILLAGLGLALLWPFMGLIALAIKLESPGPVLFRQQRHGFNNDTFEVLKFRSMRADAGGDPAVPQACQNDPRVTRVGHFLRRTSLDELPQLINVLRGEMSLVGPRPHATQHTELYAPKIDTYLGRHRIKPGITGWAQVNGLRGETRTVERMKERVRYDLYYADNWSLTLDVRIIILTFGCMIHKNAY